MTFLIIVLAVSVIVWRWGRRILPVLAKVGSMGDELGGWVLTWHFAGQPAKRAISGGAKAMLIAGAVLIGLFYRPVRWLVAGYVLFRLRRWWTGRRTAEVSLSKAGFESASERKVVAESVSQALLAMGLGSKGAEPVPPRCWRWRKLPVFVGGRKIKGAYRFECLIEPAPGRSVAQLGEYAGRGLDADEDHIRDAVNSMLRAARGRDADLLRKARAMPTFVLSTVEQQTRKGEKIGLAKLTLWSTDPFRRAIKYPYDPATPRVQSFTDRVPVGLLRSNAEATLLLARHTSVQGINGSGKSSVVRPAMVAAAHTGAVIVVLALKGPADYEDLSARFAGGLVVVDRNKAVSVLRWADREIQRRNALPVLERDALPHIWIVLDEGQELGDDIALIVPIVKKGRSAKVWLWSVTQYGLASIIPSEAAREMGQRLAGRIEGGVNQAAVAVGTRANKNRGPHLIPEDPRWTGVLFNSAGEYVRVYWVSEQSRPGQPSMMARCAAAVPPRPADPDGFTEAAAGNVTAASVLPSIDLPVWPADGAQRAPSGEALKVVIDETPIEVGDAIDRVWRVAGKESPTGTITAAQVRKVLDAAERRVAQRDAADDDTAAATALINTYMTGPLALV